MQQLVEDNTNKLNYSHWCKLSQMFARLFKRTTPYKLLDDAHHYRNAAKKIVEQIAKQEIESKDGNDNKDDNENINDNKNGKERERIKSSDGKKNFK